MKKIWTYDIEDFVNFFLVVAKHWITKEEVIFEVSDRKDDRDILKQFLKRDVGRMLGFNNLNYDNSMLQYFLLVCDKSKEQCLQLLYAKSQSIINNQVWPEQQVAEQVDAYKICHFDNKAKIASLKKVQISMDWPSVQDSTEDFTKKVTKYDEVIDYCLNDVRSTDNFIGLIIDKIRERQNIMDRTGMNCLNYSDSKLGEELILQECYDRLMTDKYEMKEWVSKPKEVVAKDVLFDWIHFDRITFKAIQDTIRGYVLAKNKDKIEFQTIIDGVKIDVKEGGIHGSLSGQWESDDEWAIMDVDVSSLYPAIMAIYNVAPRHIGGMFTEIISRMYRGRLDIKKRLQDEAISDKEKKELKFQSATYKLAMNSAYGKFNSEFSNLYDPYCMYKVTINGQLLLLKWIELLKKVDTLKLIQVNTDGIVVKIKRDQLDNYYAQCDEFCKLTGFEIEYNEYKKLAIRDVNNYCALTSKGKVKTKGEYVYDIGEDWHKRINFRVSRKAAVDYLLYGTPPSNTILESRSIYEFCGSIRFKKYKEEDDEEDEESGEQVKSLPTKRKKQKYFANQFDLFSGDLMEEPKKPDKTDSYSKGVLVDNDGEDTNLPPNTRFIYSKSGKQMYKIFNDGRVSILFEKEKVINANRIEDVCLEDLNYDKYISYSIKLIEAITNIEKTKFKGTQKLELK